MPLPVFVSKLANDSIKCPYPPRGDRGQSENIIRFALVFGNSAAIETVATARIGANLVFK